MLRLEGYRKRYAIDGAIMLRHVKALMSEADRVQLDAMTDHVAFTHGESRATGWQNLINLATHRTSKPRMARTQPGIPATIPPTPFAPAVPGVPYAKGVPAGAHMQPTGGNYTVPLQPVATVPTRPVMVSTGTGMFAQGHGQRGEGPRGGLSCELCAACPSREQYKHTHSLAQCHANPLNPNHRPECKAQNRIAKGRRFM